MFIKFTFKNTSRKIKKEVKSIEDLKTEAVKIFGDKVIYCDFMYKDEDNELVNIINNEDLTTCYEEANENNKKCIKVVLEVSSPKTKRARSISQKKKNVVINEAENKIKPIEFDSMSDDSDDTESFEEIDISSDASEGKKKEVEAKIAKKYSKLEAKIQRKMNKLNRKKQQKMKRLNRERGKNGSNSKSHSRSRSKKGRRCGKKGMPDFVKNIIDENKKAGNPWKKIKVMLENVKEEFKVYKGSPELIAKVFDKCGDKFLAIVKAASDEVKAENPELVTELVEKRQANAVRRQEGNERKLERQQKKKENQERKRIQKEKRQEENRLKKEAKKAQKAAEKAGKNQINAGVVESQPHKIETVVVEAPAKKVNPNKERNQEVKRRLDIIAPIFKDIPRPQLRKKVIEDLEALKDVQATIQSLFV